MGYQAILFCAEEKTGRMVTQVLTELDFSVEPSNEPFAAVKRLTTQHFDAVVVDCDNEQNAALLFKTARNSGPNRTSLLVAVVEGQAGIAKAFRIGANLVLTKPINIEQSKGTLRVARGLLKKGDAAKPAAAAGSHEPQSEPAGLNFGTTRPLTPASSVQKPTFTPPSFTSAPPPPTFSAGASSVLELEHDPGPQPDVADAAMLEALPEPISVQPPPTSGIRDSPWQPVKTGPAAGGLNRSSHEGAAATAPAPIKAVPHSNVETFKLKTSSAPVEAPARHEEVSKPTPRHVEPHVAAPTFGVREAAESKSGGSRTGPIVIMVLVLAAAGGYWGWTKFGAKPATTPQQSAPAQAPAPAATAPAPAASQPAAVVTPTETPATQNPTADDSGEESSPEPVEHNAAPAKPSASVAAPAPAKQTQNAIVVKSSAPKPANLDTSAPAPQLVGMTGNAGDKAISGIVAMNVVVPKPLLQTVRVSQGVSQGYLIKQVQPVYPAQARQLRIEGAVQLLATVGKDGSITSLKILGGHPMLARAAQDAVRLWKYKPYTLNGSPVEFETQVAVNFKLP